MLLYYANQANYFTPAKKTIHNATGIPESRIKDVRRKLQKCNLIDVETERDHFIFINWTAIRGYALLPEPLEVGGRSYSHFVQEEQKRHRNYPRLPLREDADQITEHLYAEDCLEWLASLTENEYIQARRRFRKATSDWNWNIRE